MVKKKEKTEEQKFKEQVKLLEKLTEIESQIIDNKIEFDFNKKKYRVRMPTIREKMIVNKKRLATLKQLQLDGFLYEYELINQLYEKQGIDINKLTNEILNLENQIKEMQLKLVPEPNKNTRERIKNIIEELQNDRLYAVVKKNNYLESSIENQLAEIMITYFAAEITEVFENKKWKKVFKSYDNFIDCDDYKLTTIVSNYVCKLLF